MKKIKHSWNFWKCVDAYSKTEQILFTPLEDTDHKVDAFFSETQCIWTEELHSTPAMRYGDDVLYMNRECVL